MADNKDLEDLAKTATEDFYELLGVTFEAEEAVIKRAYRLASIKHHPDKNPDDAGAAERFIRLGWARDILLNPTLKAIYDTSRSRRKEKALQNELLDSRRRKMKEDLEAREREGAGFLKRKRYGEGEMSEEERREMEIRRLAEDGKRRRREAMERLQREREEEEQRKAGFVDGESQEAQQQPQTKQAAGETPEIDRTVKIRFSRDGEAADWDKEKISAMFDKYGKIDSVVMGKDKKIRLSGEKHRKVVAMVFIVYTRLRDAHAAVLDAKTDYPLLDTVAWAGKEPDININIKPPVTEEFSAPSTPRTPAAQKSFRTSFSASIGSRGFPSAPGTPSFSFSPKTPNLEDITMMRLKQAEKKRLEEQIRRQEAAEEAQG